MSTRVHSIIFSPMYLSALLDYCLVKQFLYLCCTLSAPQEKHTIRGAEQHIIP